jgi:predicted phage terminase large subunit-like protein
VALSAEVIEGFVNALLRKQFDNPAEIPECHREWWRMVCSPHKFVAIAAPRGHAKSTAITLSYTLACLLFRERQFILLVSDTESQSSFFLNSLKREIGLNDDLKKFFGVEKFVKDTETDFIIEFSDGYQARIIAKGSEQKLRGINWDNKRPDLIICDDMENDEIVMNKERRDKFRRWFNGALLPCRSRDGIIRYVGTILHMDSMLERLMPSEYDKDNIVDDLKIVCSIKRFWYSAKYRAHSDDFEHVLWPEYKDKEWLKAERQNYIAQGQSDIYSQEYLNIPLDEANAYFRKSDFADIKRDEQDKKLNYYMACDLAVSTKSRADYSVFVVGGIDEDNKLHVKDVYKARMDSLEIIEMILNLNQKYDFEFCVFEKGSITASILPMLNVQMIEKNNYVNIHTINPAVDKITRAQSIRARMRAGGTKFDKSAEWFNGLESECLRFPRDVHDDQVDALALLGLALDKFVEAPTQKETYEMAMEEEKLEGGWFDIGRCATTGY